MISAFFIYSKLKGRNTMKKAIVSEQTLKILRQASKTPLLFREKTAICECIDCYGADVIELGEIKKAREDSIIFKTISSVIKNASTCITAGDTEKSISEAWECVKNAKEPILQIELPVSAVTMEYKYHVKDDKMAEKIYSLCKTAKMLCENVEFSALDATRADPDFLRKAICTAVEAGATCVSLCDDDGGSLPEDIKKLVTETRKYCNATLLFKPSNRLGMATACAVAAISGGADGVKTAVSGNNALRTDVFAEVAKACGEKLGFFTNLKTTELKSDIKELIKKADKPFSDVSRKDANHGNDIYLDSQSTLTEVSNATKQLGYSLSAADDGEVYRELQRVCEKKSAVGGKELDAIIASTAMQAPAIFHLKTYNTVSGNRSGAMASITLEKGESELIGTAVGDGPIDASFKAIEQCIGYHYELDAFRIQAVTEGKEALGATLVRLRNDGKLYAGNGVSTDIVGSAIRAYVNALNKIVSEEENS